MIGLYLAMLDTDEEKKKFKDLYKKYRQDMFQVAYSILNNEFDAEDAVEESFFRIAKKFNLISSVSNDKIKSYVIIIAKNAAIDIIRNDKNYLKNFDELDTDEIIKDTFFDEFEYREVMHAVSKLPEKYKDVLYLYYLKGFDAKSTGEMLGLKTDNVRKIASRAKIMLKKFIEGDNDNG